MPPPRRPEPKPNPSSRRTLIEAHWRLDEHERTLDALDQAHKQAMTATITTAEALKQLSAVVIDLKGCTVSLQATLVDVVRDNEAGRKTFEIMFTRVLQEQAFTWMKLVVGTALMSSPSWAGKAWSLIHG